MRARREKITVELREASGTASSRAATPSLSFTLLELANIGRWGHGAGPAPGDGGPWGIGLLGHTANQGGVYSTVRIPFGSASNCAAPSDIANGEHALAQDGDGHGEADDGSVG